MEQKQSFWSTLPGVLTQIATIVTAVAGIVAVFKGCGPEPMKPETVAIQSPPPEPARQLDHQPRPNVRYRILPMSGGEGLSLDEGDGRVVQYTSHNGPRQQWTFERYADLDSITIFRIHCGSGSCLAFDGSNVVTSQCSSAAEQQWSVTWMYDDVYRIFPRARAALTLDVPDASDRSGLQINLFAWHAEQHANQLWKIVQF